MEPNENLTEATRARLAWADQIEALVRSVLETLEFGLAAAMPAADLVYHLTAWLSLLGLVKRDAHGRFGSVWWAAYQAFLKRPGYIDGGAAHDEAAKGADLATGAFARRFPPLANEIEEPERDTETDLDAMRRELEEKDVALAAAMQRIEQLEAQGVNGQAMVALPKPQEVVANQRWAQIHVISRKTNGPDVRTIDGDTFAAGWLLTSNDWVYLGT